MRCVDPGDGFASWREAARRLLIAGVPPEEILWQSDEEGLFGGSLEDAGPKTGAPAAVPADFLKLARSVACYDDPTRWGLLYRMLWRITRGGEKHLLDLHGDPDLVKARQFEKNIRREIHKMHAFVRFRKVGEADDGRERFVAWFEPQHHIVEAGTPFFRKRFANMDWSIFTPKGCAHWIGGEFVITSGIARDPFAGIDELEEIWCTYYKSIFNPARLKLKAMQAEMPRKYWKNLPEAGLIDELTRRSGGRIGDMLATPERPAKPLKTTYLNSLRSMSKIPETDVEHASLDEIAKLIQGCRNCPLWENATCAVPGEGPSDARVMIVGEQPGDREDLEGRPFVGPAGKLLDEALIEAGVDRSRVYVTNAVKHFKWVPRGKHRLHQKPSAGEIDACKPWLLGEMSKIAPEVLILLGATAARAILGPGVKVTEQRGLVDAPGVAARVILTVHPSYLLRIPDKERKADERSRFIEDLTLARG